MVAMRILACFLAAQITTGSRQNFAHLVMDSTKNDTSKLSHVAETIDWTQHKIEETEKYVQSKVAALPGPKEEPKYSDAGVALELGEKKQGSHSIKGSMSISMDSKAPEPTPDESGRVPAHGEIEFKADSQAQAEKLLENIEQIMEKFLGEAMKELKEQLPKLTVEGNSIKLRGDHMMPYEQEEYKSIQEKMKVVTRFSISHDVYLDMDMWVKNPTMKLLDVYTGMKGGVSARVSEETLKMLSGIFEGLTSNETSMAPVKDIFGDDYESVIEKLKNMLKGNEVTIKVPGFDKMKEQMEGTGDITFNETKAQFENTSKALNMSGNEYAVVALNLVQQAAAANLRFSSASVSMFGGAVKAAWTLEGMTFFNTVANAAQEAGAEQLIYGSKKPEDYNIPGVQSKEQIEKIAELGKNGAGVFAKCHAVALVIVAALMNWVV
jgi:hypothetical protein